MTTKKIKASIFQLLEKFEKQRQKENVFTPGKSKVRYSGAFYNHKDMIAMTDAILNGWFGLGRYGEQFEQNLILKFLIMLFLLIILILWMINHKHLIGCLIFFVQ